MLLSWTMEVPKPPPLRPSIGTPDTVTVAVTFTPPDVEEIRRVADLSLFQVDPIIRTAVRLK